MGSGQIFEILTEMHSDTFRNAAPLPMKEENRVEWQGLGFQLGGIRLVSALGEVSEILNIPRITHLPGVQPWLLGVANVRGRLIPIVDLHGYFDIATSLPRKDWRVLIVEDDGLITGLLVEQSLGMQHFLEENFEDVVPSDLDELKPNLRGAYRHSGRMFYVVNLKSLIQEKKFLEVAKRNGR